MSDVIKFPPQNSSEPAAPRVHLVSRSIRYRRRAARLGQQADAETSEEKMLPLMHQALSWIQLAENEEFLAQADTIPLVLVVEDKPLQRLDAVSMIESAGFEAIGAKNADDAIAILELHQRIEIVFTDIRMPGSMDGLKLAEAINARWPSIPVVATSGNVLGEEQLPEGCVFLPKPYSQEQIAGTIQRLVRSA
jgi:CheY-like chemotaxis protein